MIKNHRHRAFSLIEISVVIVIIGILIAGISSGIELYDDFKLKVAQNITKNSRVSRIPDLEAWYETTSENSLATGTTTFADKSNPADQDQIGRWNDINPNIIATAKNNATQGTLDNQPKYIRKGMNGLPTLLFDGTNDFFSFNGDFLAGADYTIFVVEARNSGKNNNFFIAGSQNLESQNLILGYWYKDIANNRDIITHSHYSSNRIDKAISVYNSPILSFHSFVFGKNLGKESYLNGVQKIFNISQKTPLASYQNSTIGKAYSNDFYQGFIAEIIFYSRALTDKERQEVELYLSKKWGVKLG